MSISALFCHQHFLLRKITINWIIFDQLQKIVAIATRNVCKYTYSLPDLAGVVALSVMLAGGVVSSVSEGIMLVGLGSLL